MQGLSAAFLLAFLFLQILRWLCCTYICLIIAQERQEILKIHVSKWDNKPDPVVLSNLAEQAYGYCGSDLRALCSESVIQALRRTYPQIYKSSQRLLIDANKVQVIIKF